MTATAALDHRLGRTTWVALLIASAVSLALVVGAVTLPFYSSQSVDSSGVTTSGSATLVGENGWGVLVVVSIPLVVVLLVACLLWFGRGGLGARRIAWVLVSLLGAFNLLALLTIGIFILPVTVCLVVACAGLAPTVRQPVPL